jgi:2-polyprenyl-3-methyl-5-hydroxy-6-metoxy-1,4-benzoquinol methylase
MKSTHSGNDGPQSGRSFHEYEDKQRDYFNVDRHDLLELVPADPPGRVLEIGAAQGSTLVALKRLGRASEVVGVELMSIAGSQQTSPDIDRFIVADVEQQDLDLLPGSFDVMILGDVLEHLRDPWAALTYLTGFLRVGGTAIISLPNIRYWRALGKIVLGDFRYAESGVLDRTHLRFFARKNILDLVRFAQLRIDSVEPSFVRQRPLRTDRRVNALTLGLLEPFLAQQYLVVATRVDAVPPGAMVRPPEADVRPHA